MPRLEVPYVPRLLVPGQQEGIPLPPTSTASPSLSRLAHLAREDWLWKHHRSPLTRAFLAPMRGGAADSAGDNDVLRWALTPATAYPMSIAVRFNPDVTTGNMRIFGMFDSTTANNRVSILITDSTPDKTGFEVSGSGGRVDSTVAISAGTWFHGTGRGVSTTSRFVYTDGADEQQSTSSQAFSTGLDRVSFGGIDGTSIITDYNGKAAEAAIWDADIGSGGAASLGAAGAHPFMVLPASLQFYAPMIRGTPWNDVITGTAATVVSAISVFEHPPVMQPGAVSFIGVPSAVAVTAVLTGTTVPSDLESEIVTGTRTSIITLTGDTWLAAGASFDGERQGIIDGFDSAQVEAAGWNAEVRDKELVGAVARTSDTVVTVTWAAAGAYVITADETITCTVPASALVTSVGAITATPTFDITNEGGVTTRRYTLSTMGVG
ncbi:MAG TPA: hypothetical protein VMX11_07145 [Actinomycetes bacterium]|nr:hypothetical protein [Actinomycetes bacterium]